MKELRLSRAAESDLEEAWLHIAEESGHERADSVLDEIESRSRLLLAYPEAGRERSELWPGLRSFPASSHVVYYEVSGPAVEVVRVLHGARDAEAELLGDVES